MTRVVVWGATGRTGGVVRVLAEERGVYHGGVADTADGDVVEPGEADALVESADAVVDFSTPEGTLRAAETAARTETPLVTGTTALTDEAVEAVEKAADAVAVVRSSNYAVGVNVFWSLVESLAHHLPGADYEVTETHHAGKRDAPSGTALATVERLTRELGERDVVHGRQGEAPRGDEIGVHSRRAGDVVGQHEVLAADGAESLRLVHEASDRRAFAEGALDAAEYAVDSPPGLYDMDDVLGL
ncbi:MAG: 4-hydroxy-tetrahydrodipicolinate reductase [Halobacteriales archaeon]